MSEMRRGQADSRVARSSWAAICTDVVGQAADLPHACRTMSCSKSFLMTCVVLVRVLWQLRVWSSAPCAEVLASRALSSSDLGVAGAGAVCWGVKVPTASCLRECPQWAWCFDLLGALGVLSFLYFGGCGCLGHILGRTACDQSGRVHSLICMPAVLSPWVGQGCRGQGGKRLAQNVARDV